MRLTPERLFALGQRSAPPQRILTLPRSRGPSTLLGHRSMWIMQTLLKAGALGQTDSELCFDQLEERTRSRFNQDIARTGRTLSSTPNRSNVPRDRLFYDDTGRIGRGTDRHKESLRNMFAAKSTLRGMSKLRFIDNSTGSFETIELDSLSHPPVSMGGSVPCPIACALCALQGKPAIKWSWKK